MIRKLLNENIRDATVGLGDLSAPRGGWGGYSKVGLSFSGGTDSLCILFSCLEMGMRPVLYTYKVAGVDSPDHQRAERMAKHFGLKLVTAEIPTAPAVVYQQIKEMIALGVEPGTVHIQCCHGHYLLSDKVETSIILNGSGVDGIYGSYRTFGFAGATKDKAVFDEMRQKHLDNPNDDAMEDQSMLYGGRTRYPFRQQNIISFLMGLDWQTINRPKQKQIAYQDYPEFTHFKGLFRPRGSQQLVAGTKQVHEKLLHTTYNVNHRKRTREFYLDIAKGVTP